MPRYTEQEAREAVRSSRCYAEALRKLGLQPAGGNHRLFRKYVDEVWEISTDHFDPVIARVAALKHRAPYPLADVLREGSTYNRMLLKQRLYDGGLKARNCELCGQGETWRGLPMSLILDHINGVPTDNRLENLRIVCPNCAATFDTHCGRKNRMADRECAHCGRLFSPKTRRQRYCSSECGTRHDRRARSPQPARRKVPRPAYVLLLADLQTLSVAAVGRKYGVSGNSIRKWLRWYQAEATLARSDRGDRAGSGG